MAINLVKLENDLKNAPDQAIVGYVQNPSGQVPTYLALAELERRKRMRQGAMASQGGEQPSVADQLVAESQPQPQMGGIADIPVQNVGNEESYAAGGIVAFEDGGSVTGGLSLEELEEIASRLATARKYKEASESQGGISPAAAAQKYAEQQAARQYVLGGPQAIPTNPFTNSLGPQGIPQALVSPAQQPVLPTQAQQPNASIIPPQQPQTGGVNAPPRVPAGPGAAPQGIQSLYQAPENPWANYNPEAATTAEAEMARMQGVLGVDPFRAKSQERLAAMEARATQEEKTAPWMALAEAGFAIAGGDSPYALQNIGRGAQKGVESLAKAKERAAAAEEKRFGIESELARAERAEQVAIARFGFDSEQASKERNRREELEKRKGDASYKSEVATNQFKDKQFQMEHKLEREKLKQQREISNKTPAEIQLIERYAKEAGLTFPEAFDAIQSGKRTKRMTDEEIAKVLLEKNPMIADDPVAFRKAIESYREAVSGQDFSGWGQLKTK